MNHRWLKIWQILNYTLYNMCFETDKCIVKIERRLSLWHNAHTEDVNTIVKYNCWNEVWRSFHEGYEYSKLIVAFYVFIYFNFSFFWLVKLVR